MDLSIVIPLLNEAESLPELEAWIRRVVEKENLSYEIVFVDDGSTDNSWSIIQGLAKNNPNIHALRFRKNYGKSPALNEGFKVVQGDVVITMDADLQDSPDEIPELYRMIKEEGYDLVSGWKKKRYDSKVMKNIPSKFFNWTKLQAVVEDSQLVVTIDDDGQPFDPTADSTTDFSVPADERPPGGLGIMFLHKMTDGLEYQRLDGHNVLRIMKGKKQIVK